VAAGTRAADAVRVPLQRVLGERVRFVEAEVMRCGHGLAPDRPKVMLVEAGPHHPGRLLAGPGRPRRRRSGLGDRPATGQLADAPVQPEVGQAEPVQGGAGALVDVPVVADGGAVLGGGPARSMARSARRARALPSTSSTARSAARVRSCRR
jgi:hypothetical protein